MMEGQKILIALALISVFGCAISIRISDLALYNFLNNRPANGRERNLDAQYWIETLGITNVSPTGGYFAINFVSNETTTDLPPRFQGGRRPLGLAVTCLLQGNQVSRFHSITADEQWHFYYGNPFTVYLIDPNTGALEVVNLGPQEGRFNVVIPNGHIYGARMINPRAGGYTMFGVSVFPAVEISDLTVYNRQELLQRFPQHYDLIVDLTEE